MKLETSTYIDQLRAVGEPNRLRILLLLLEGELSVGELVEIMGQSQPRLSHHLKTLTSARLVERLPEGSWVFYHIPAIGPARHFLDMILAPIDRSVGEFAHDFESLARIRAARVEAAATYFSEIADTWDTVRSLHSPNETTERALLELAGPGPFDRLVDIGTGTGRMLSLFAGRAARLDGVDFSHRMLTVARANLARDGVGHAHVRHGDARTLPFESASADIVIIHQVLHFLDEPERAIGEAARILVPGGLLMIVDFAPHALEYLREKHGHRRLGIRGEALAGWTEKAGMILEPETRFEQPENVADGLTVQLWRARKHAAGSRSTEGSI